MIVTARLLLRPLAAGDLDDYAALSADPDVARWLGGPATRDETAAWLERRRLDYERQGYGVMTVFDRASGAFLGRCGLAHQHIDGADELELGYALVRSAWGKGYATEAASAVRDLALGPLGRARLIALVQPANERSAAVATRLGMRHEKDVAFHGRAHRVYALDV